MGRGVTSVTLIPLNWASLDLCHLLARGDALGKPPSSLNLFFSSRKD